MRRGKPVCIIIRVTDDAVATEQSIENDHRQVLSNPVQSRFTCQQLQFRAFAQGHIGKKGVDLMGLVFVVAQDRHRMNVEPTPLALWVPHAHNASFDGTACRKSDEGWTLLARKRPIRLIDNPMVHREKIAYLLK